MKLTSRYVVVCPNCHEADKLQEIDYNCFECDCGEEFEIERASVQSID